MNQELKNLVGSILDLGKILGLIVEKKGIDASELAPLEQLVLEIQPALSSSAAALAQLKALDSAGEADLVSYIVSKLALSDAKAGNVLLKALQAVIAAYELEKAIKA